MSEISETARDQLDPELGESSEGEGDVEIEHLGDESVEVQEDNVENPPLVVSNFSSTSPMGDVRPASNITLDIRKRTLITFAQRTVLEDLYRNGMSSASLQLHHLHVLAAERTGLDLAVVKNWIRNRRRPTAVKSAEKMVEKLVAEKSGVGMGTLSMPTIPATMTPNLPVPALTSVAMSIPPALTTAVFASRSSPDTVLMSEPKRVCLEPVPHNATASPVYALHHSPSSSSSSPLLVKVRVVGSGECDFVEVEVPSATYPALLKACCEELEVQTSDVVKIRKLPNVWVRKDRDVQRMKEGQELEVVLKLEGGGGTHLTSMLTVNPFSSGTALPILNLQSIRSDTDNGLMAALANEVPPDIHSNGLHQ